MTVDAIQYYDFNGNRVRLDTMRGGLPGTALYDFGNNEAIYITSKCCFILIKI